MNEKNYIKKSIKKYYLKRLLSPVIFLIAVAVLFVIFPAVNMLHPTSVDFTEDSITGYTKAHSHTPYVTTPTDTMYFTGYKETFAGYTIGYYYYTMMGDECVIVLLSPGTSQEGMSTIENITLTARIMRDKATREELLASLASDLSWTSAGIESEISDIVLSEPDAVGPATAILRFVIYASLIFAIVSLLFYTMWVLFPVMSPPIRRLTAFGRPANILAEAEIELSTLPQLATDDMFITEHYFIETSDYGVAIVPIDQIIWIYKYSTLHKFLWIHFAISYTLNINAGRHHYIRCPKNTKTDIDGIMDYLAEANHDILVGFTEENRRLAQRRSSYF